MIDKQNLTVGSTYEYNSTHDATVRHILSEEHTDKIKEAMLAKEAYEEMLSDLVGEIHARKVEKMKATRELWEAGCKEGNFSESEMSSENVVLDFKTGAIILLSPKSSNGSEASVEIAGPNGEVIAKA